MKQPKLNSFFRQKKITKLVQINYNWQFLNQLWLLPGNNWGKNAKREREALSLTDATSHGVGFSLFTSSKRCLTYKLYPDTPFLEASIPNVTLSYVFTKRFLLWQFHRTKPTLALIDSNIFIFGLSCHFNWEFLTE